MEITERKLKELEEANNTESKQSLEFLEEYKKLVSKYKRDFAMGEVKLIKVDFVDPAVRPPIE